MYFQRFYDIKLAQASYLIGCQRTGEAVVVDPNRDIEQYVAAAAREGLRITHVTETHIHADFVSGARELAAPPMRCSSSPTRGATTGSTHSRLKRSADCCATATFSRRQHRARGDAHTRAHAGAPELPRHRRAGERGRGGPHRRLRLRRRRRAARSPRARRRVRGHDGGSGAYALPIAAALPVAARISAVWPGHGAGSACGKALGAMPSTRWVTRSGQLGARRE